MRLVHSLKRKIMKMKSVMLILQITIWNTAWIKSYKRESVGILSREGSLPEEI